MKEINDVKKIYCNTLSRILCEKKKVMVVDVDLMRIAGTESIAKEYPNQYMNVGIAEQNAVGVAAGLAAMGNTVFVSAFCEFLAGRAADQCMNTICYNGLEVKLIGTYAGISSGINGGTHISVNDNAIFRSMPGMHVIEIADGREMEQALTNAVNIKGPVYIRVPKGPLYKIFPEKGEIKLDRACVLTSIPRERRLAKRIALITCGITTIEGIKATKLLKKIDIPITHLHITTLKPIDSVMIKKIGETHNVIVTAENHSVIGGLADAVSQVISAHTSIRIFRLGIDDVFCEGMKESELLERHGISAESLAKFIKYIFGNQK